jgi:hypothetical protein
MKGDQQLAEADLEAFGIKGRTRPGVQTIARSGPSQIGQGGD